MQDPAQGRGIPRNPQRTAERRQTPGSFDRRVCLPAIAPGRVALEDLARGIEWRCYNDPHVMALSGKPVSHFARVFAVANEFGGKIDAVNENAHAQPFRELDSSSSFAVAVTIRQSPRCN